MNLYCKISTSYKGCGYLTLLMFCPFILNPEIVLMTLSELSLEMENQFFEDEKYIKSFHNTPAFISIFKKAVEKNI